MVYCAIAYSSDLLYAYLLNSHFSFSFASISYTIISPQMGTVALPGMTSVYETDDPVVIIAEHPTLGVTLHEKVVDPVDLVVLCDRSKRTFAERKFFVFDDGNKGGELTIGAFTSKDEIPESVTILGQVTFVQIPWLPMMQKKKSGFSEDDDLF